MLSGMKPGDAYEQQRPSGMSKQLEFWFEFGSTYSYPTAARIENLTRDRGIALTWRPFLLGPIFRQQGWEDSLFNIYPAKGAYMERLCATLNIPFQRPNQFPRNGLLAARVALLCSRTVAARLCPQRIRGKLCPRQRHFEPRCCHTDS